MMALLRMMRALFLRGWYSMLSYRFALYLKYVGAAFQIIVLYFIWQVFKDMRTAVDLGSADGDWFAFAVTGGLAMSVLGTAMGAMVGDIRSGQVMGTLETILASPMSVTLLLSANWVYSFTRTFVSLILSVLLCAWLLDFKFADATATALPPQVSSDNRDGALIDVDDDGLQDLVTSVWGRQNTLYVNVGGAEFQDFTQDMPKDADFSGAMAVGDLDGNGEVDLFVGNRLFSRIYLNFTNDNN